MHDWWALRKGLYLGRLYSEVYGMRNVKPRLRKLTSNTATKVILTVLINAILTKVRMAVLAWLH